MDKVISSELRKLSTLRKGRSLQNFHIVRDDGLCFTKYHLHYSSNITEPL